MTAHQDATDIFYDDAPSIAVLTWHADAAPALAAARAGGVRPTGPAVARADWESADMPATPLFWLELGGTPDKEAAALLDGVRTRAEQGLAGGVICAPNTHVDLLAARGTHDAVHLVVDGSADDRAVALGLVLADAAGRRVARVHEGSASEVERLRRLTEEVSRIAQSLAKMSDTAGKGARPSRRERESEASARSSQAVRAMVRARRLRDQFFQPELFADPAWDMLLDLYAAHLDQHRVAVSSLCIASAVPATTALRWIKTLTDNGLFVRRADPTDGRRVFIELSPETADAMEAYFSELERQAEGVAWSGSAVA